MDDDGRAETHWDRERYRTFQQFRRQLVALGEKLLGFGSDILAQFQTPLPIEVFVRGLAGDCPKVQVRLPSDYST